MENIQKSSTFLLKNSTYANSLTIFNKKYLEIRKTLYTFAM